MPNLDTYFLFRAYEIPMPEDPVSLDENETVLNSRPILRARRTLTKKLPSTERIDFQDRNSNEGSVPDTKAPSSPSTSYVEYAPPEKSVKLQFKDHVEVFGQTLRSGKVVPTIKSAALVRTLTKTGLVNAKSAQKKPNGKSFSTGNLGDKIILSPTKKKSKSNLGRKTSDAKRKELDRYTISITV